MTRMYRRIATLLIGAMGGQALAFTALPFVLWLYTPEQLGRFQIMLTFCNALGVVAALSLERGLLTQITSDQAAHLRGLARRVVWASAGLSVPLYLVFAQVVPAAPLMIAGVPVVGFVVATVLFRGLYLIDYTAAVADRRTRQASASIFVKDAVRAGLRLLLGFSLANPVGLFLAGMADWATGLWMLRRKDTKARPTKTQMVAAWTHHRALAVFYAPTAALTVICAQIPVVLLGLSYPLHQVGLYSIAFLLLDRPSRIFAKAGGDVIMQSLALASRTTSQRATIRKAFVLVGADAIALILLATVAAAIAPSVFGEQWSGTAVLVFACVPHVLALYTSDISIGMFAAVAQSAARLSRQITALAALCLGFAMAQTLGLSVVATVAVMGALHLAVQLGVLILFALQFQRLEPATL